MRVNVTAADDLPHLTSSPHSRRLPSRAFLLRKSYSLLLCIAPHPLSDEGLFTSDMVQSTTISYILRHAQDCADGECRPTSRTSQFLAADNYKSLRRGDKEGEQYFEGLTSGSSLHEVKEKSPTATSTYPFRSFWFLLRPGHNWRHFW